ncbi:MAG TPA: dUTP diphosphatase [Bacilli bacterium]|nr:dUTP diphosphatase [Bacilli bacterium]
MNWQRLFDIQKQLDDHIVAEHGLNRSELTRHKLLALHVELGELANETRCFKYWSRKPAAPRATILEEYVDALHFVLSLGLDWAYTDLDFTPEAPGADLTEQFQRVIERTVACQGTRTEEKPEASAYRALFSALLTLGGQLGFSEREIESAYLAKNEVNHQRQEQGY